jgi:hypothetical protein
LAPFRSGPWWTFTYQPAAGTTYSEGITLVVVALPEPSAVTVCREIAIGPPALQLLPLWMCDGWLLLADSPVMVTTTVKEPLPGVTVTVPVAAEPPAAVKVTV